MEVGLKMKDIQKKCGEVIKTAFVLSPYMYRHFVKLVLEIEASKPPRIDLKSSQRYRNDPFV